MTRFFQTSISCLIFLSFTLPYFVNASPNLLDNDIETQVGNISIFTTRNLVSPYKIQLNIFGREFQLELSRPSSSIFSPNFPQRNGRTLQDLLDLEKNIFVDENTQTVLKISQNPSLGIYEIHGVVQGYGITYTNGVVKAHRSKNPGHCGVKHNHENPVIDLEPQRGHEIRPKVELYQNDANSGILDVLLLMDSTHNDAVIAQGLTINEYCAISIRTANIIYSTLTNPQLQLRLLECRQLTDDEETEILVETESYIDAMLNNLTVLLQTTPSKYDPSDNVSLLTGKRTLDSNNGVISMSVTGLAHRASACTPMKGSIVRDLGTFEGVHTMAHEMGHTVGCAHDFQTDACPVATYCPDDFSMCDGMKCCKPGNVMDYGTSGKIEAFSFSQCSKDQIYKFSQSPKGKICLTREGPMDDRYPGEVVSWTSQCQTYVVKKDAEAMPGVPDSDIVPSCLVGSCPYTNKRGKAKVFNNVAPLDGTPCQGSNKKKSYYCVAGVCVIKPDTPT